MQSFRMLIGGELVGARSDRTTRSIDPGTGKPIAELSLGGAEDGADAVTAAHRAFETWSRRPVEERARVMMDLADRMTDNLRDLAVLEARDSGGTLKRTGGDVFLGARLMRNLARYAMRDFPWVEEIGDAGDPFIRARHLVRREPMGVCVAIVPWNFPLLMAIWKITMAALMGNTVVLKPASDTPVATLALAKIIVESNVPPGVINIVTGSGSELGEALVADHRVAKIAFTGSTEVGRRIMTMAAGTIKKTTLELGGKSANIVLEDADLDSAVDGAILATFLHSGQVCTSGTRLLLPDSRYDEFMDALIQRTEGIRVGYQLDPATKMGPLVSAKQRRTVEEYVAIGRDEGATVVTGGERVEIEGFENGFYYSPTIFGDVDNSMRIAQEEIFGPVLSVVRYHDEDEVIAIANASTYGLAGGIWSRDLERAQRVAEQVRTGTLWINDYHVFSDLAPFGGYKQSGTGRELGHYGLAEFTEIKHVHLGAEGHPIHRPGNRLLLKYPRTTSFAWSGPTHLEIGAGRAAMAGVLVDQRLGCRRALLISDAGVNEAGLTDIVRGALGSLLAGEFLDVPQDSGLEVIDACADHGRAVDADCVVALGGGSVLDTAKAAVVVLSEGRQAKAMDAVGIQLLSTDPLPLLAIPTTAGTGSEVTNCAVIRDANRGRKVYIVDDRIIPPVAILDPQLTVGLPPLLTASTGMDALTHAIEAVVSRQANPISEGLALQAIRMIAINLPLVTDDPGDLEARVLMQQASTMAGWAFSVAQVGLVHGMSHALGARHGVPHGIGNGILLPHVMRFNQPAATPQLVRVAEALGCERDGRDDAAMALAAADAVAFLLERTGHPTKLRAVHVPESGLEACAQLAVEDLATMTNPRPVRSPKEVVEVYLQAM